MKIFLLGTSSTGKTSLTNKFPKKYKPLRIDDYYESYYDQYRRKILRNIKNEFISHNELDNRTWKELDKIFLGSIRKYSNVVIDDINTVYLKAIPKSLKRISFLIYSPFKDLIRNIYNRRSSETRDLNVFNQFSYFYVATCDQQKAIDTINRPQFIQDLQAIKWLFESPNHLKNFAISIFQQIGIVTDEPYMIRLKDPIFDYVINTNGKSIDEIYNEIVILAANKGVKIS